MAKLIGLSQIRNMAMAEVKKDQLWLRDKLNVPRIRDRLIPRKWKTVERFANLAVKTALGENDFRGNFMNVAFAAQSAAPAHSLDSKDVFNATVEAHHRIRE